MKFKDSKQLFNLTLNTGLTVEMITDKIISKLIEHEILFDDPEIYGKYLKNAIDGSTTVKKFMMAIGEIGLGDRCENLINILDLYIMGDGDCVECGGNMIMTDCEKLRLSDDPQDFVYEWQEFECDCCKEYKKVK